MDNARPEDANSTRPQLNPLALSLASTAQLLAKATSARVTEEMLRADLAHGAPANPDGTINLVQYGAWLVKELPHAV
jgi:hypothetical protein